MRSHLLPLSLVLLAACAPANRVTVELPGRLARSGAKAPAPSGYAKPSGSTIAMLAEAAPFDSQFLPDGRLVALTGTDAYVADPRASAPWGGLRRVPFDGMMRPSEDRTRYFRVGRSAVAEVDTTSLADRRTFEVPGLVMFAIPNADGSKLLVSHTADVSAPRSLTVVDTKTFRPLFTVDSLSTFSGQFSDNGRYVAFSDDGTVVLDAATGKEVRRSQEPFDVVGDYAVTSRGASLVLEQMATHEKHTLALPCAGKTVFWHGHAAVACGSKLGVIRVAPRERVKVVDAKAPITYFDADVSGDGFRLMLGGLQLFFSTATGALAGQEAPCRAEDWNGNVVGTGERFCQAAVSPDGKWLSRRGINLVRASDGHTVFDLPWQRGPSDSFVTVQGNQLVAMSRGEGAEPFFVPFDDTRRAPTYLARRTRSSIEVISMATQAKVATLPVEMSSAQIEGSGDEVVVMGKPLIGPPVVRCSLSKATCSPIESAGCTAVAVGEGRTLCAPASGQGGTLTQLVPGASPRSLSVGLAPSPDFAYATRDGWVLHRPGPLLERIHRAMFIPAAGFGSTKPAWKEMPGAILGASGTSIVTERTPSALDIMDLVTNDTTRIVLTPRSAVKIFADGRVAFQGDRAEAEAQLLCVRGDRVMPWSECRDREAGW